jgi:hypothetical protein
MNASGLKTDFTSIPVAVSMYVIVTFAPTLRSPVTFVFELRAISQRSFPFCIAIMLSFTSKTSPVTRYAMNWLIWSSDHGGWSKPNRHGYTNCLADAGRYSFDEALEIVQDANSKTFARNFPSETMCPDWTEETPGAEH